MTINVALDGTVAFVYDDDLLPLMKLGKAAIRRASHVEPTPEGTWKADLSPVNGPLLGPFATRADALRVEKEWLEAHLEEIAS